MNVLFAGGGTGGHLYPAIAMAAELSKLAPDTEISFAGTAGGIEAVEVPRLGYRLHLIPVRGLKRGGTLAVFVANIGVVADFVGSFTTKQIVSSRIHLEIATKVVLICVNCC